MNFFIDGPDASGKTTIAEKLAERLNTKVIHSTAKTNNNLEYHMNYLNGDNQVFDRFHLSELVFQKIYNRPERLTMDDFYKINQKIVDNGDYLILFYTSDINILNSRLIERKEFDYLNEIKVQNEEFMKLAYVLCIYEDMHIKFIDVAKPDCYDRLDEYIENIFKENGVNN